ncbi:MAG: alpha/beta hydrolase [Eubacteriales bacterium]|nr:alpha/beta hydrolase [Eubacteriales bacterium]
MLLFSYIKNHIRVFLLIFTAVFLLLYTVFIYFLVSAALVPSFMNRLHAFETITENSYAEQVQTSDLQRNHLFASAIGEQISTSVPPIKKEIISNDGFHLAAAEFQNKLSADYVLLLHGYTGWKEEMYPYAAWYYSRGYNILVPDLRCHGESEGDFIGMGWTDRYALLLWIDQILQESPHSKIIIHGVSMGAASALILSGMEELPENVSIIIADCSYTDAYTMFRKQCRDWFHLPSFPLVDSANLMLQLRGGYDLKKASPQEAVKHSHTPTLFIHGTEDAIIPYSHTEQLYNDASCPKELLLMPNAGHGQAVDSSPLLYYETISDFLKKWG